MQLYGLNGLPETIAALKVQAAGYRTEAVKVAKKVNDYINSANFQNNRSQGFVEEDGWASQTKSEWDRAIARENNKLRRWRAEALMLEQRAAVIEGSIISLKLQEQQQNQAAAQIVTQAKAAALAVEQAKAAAIAAAQAKAKAAANAAVQVKPGQATIVTTPSKPVPIVSPVPPQVRVTAPGNVSKASAPQVPEAPLPITLPPISKIQPVTIIPTVPGLPGAPGRTGAPGVPGTPAPSTDMKKLLPWILAAGAAFLF